MEYVSRTRISSVCSVWMSEHVCDGCWIVQQTQTKVVVAAGLAERDRATKTAGLYAFWRPSPDRRVSRPLPAPPSSVSQKLKQSERHAGGVGVVVTTPPLRLGS